MPTVKRKATKSSPELHQKAWEIYSKSLSYASVAKDLGIDSRTASYWGTNFYECPWKCPFHDYQRLIRHRDNATNVQIQMIEAGEENDERIDDAGREALQLQYKHPLELQKDTYEQMKLMTRSDAERITHWEYLYGKVFFHMTGIALNYDQVKVWGGIDTFRKNAEELYQEGLGVPSLEKGVYMLGYIEEQIERLKKKYAPQGNQKQEEETKSPLPIDELRRLRMALESVPATNISIALNNIREEERVIDVNYEEK
jgi:hypothetical protein